MSGLNMWIVFFVTFLTYFGEQSAEEGVTGGSCYSQAQRHCQSAVEEFWAALITNQLPRICRYLQEMSTCIENSISGCNYKSSELELFEKDVISVYTKAPYNCGLTRGSIEKYSPQTGQSSSASTSRLALGGTTACGVLLVGMMLQCTLLL